MISKDKVNKFNPYERIKVKAGNLIFEGLINQKFKKQGSILIEDVSGKGAIIQLKSITSMEKI